MKGQVVLVYCSGIDVTINAQ